MHNRLFPCCTFQRAGIGNLLYLCCAGSWGIWLIGCCRRSRGHKTFLPTAKSYLLQLLDAVLHQRNGSEGPLQLGMRLFIKRFVINVRCSLPRWAQTSAMMLSLASIGSNISNSL